MVIMKYILKRCSLNRSISSKVTKSRKLLEHTTKILISLGNKFMKTRSNLKYPSPHNYRNVKRLANILGGEQNKNTKALQVKKNNK